MNKIYIPFVLLFTCTVFSQNVTIPDTNFKNYLLTNVEVNTNNDLHIQVSEAEATTSLSFQFWQVDDLTGIEAFTNLTFLDCGDNNLTTIDLSQNQALEQLYCYDNQLTSLNLDENENLFALDCRNNLLSSLDMSNNPLLFYLNCPFNNITTLNVTDTAIQTLRAYSNAIVNLIITNTETTLETLLVYNNNFIELDLGNHSALTVFECQNSSSLINLNIKNGNNTNISTFRSSNTPNLACIQVDDVTYSSTNWTNIDAENNFQEDCTLGIETFNFMLSMYPNPVTNSLHLELLEQTQYSIISIEGKIVKNGELLKGSNILDVSILSENIYLMQLKTAFGKSLSTRFVKK